jgi:sodium transport system permease protein
MRSISTIYRKELADILRDRRTLIAMVLVPIVLYPLLMLGSIQAAQFQSERLHREALLIAVPNARMGRWLAAQIDMDNVLAPKDGAAEDYVEDYKILVSDDPVRAVREGAAHVALIARDGAKRLDQWITDPPFAIVYDSAEVRGSMARSRLDGVLERQRARIRTERLARVLPDAQRPLINLAPIPTKNIASPEKVGGSMLGHVLPLILVIMTITGGVYPAIDLTAGERERGTLETLMVAPVPILNLIVGKFLVVATVSMLAAALNLASIGLTLHFGDVQSLLASGAQARIPFAVLPIIFVAMVPFAILFGAILIAVASFARTFKEAQNYIMPVIIMALIPATAGSLPGVELNGPLMVVPVANMVLLTRELLLGHFAAWPAMVVALGSTCFYAAVAVVIAARLFGQEAVLFSDAGSWKNLFRRRLFPRRDRPTAAHALLLVAALFPAWFHIQGQVGNRVGLSAVLIAVWFGLVPVLVAVYLKIDLRTTFAWRRGRPVQYVGAALIGLGSWALAYELLVLQAYVLPMPEAFTESGNELLGGLERWPLALVLIALAVVPGICEELTFRGFVLSGLRSEMRALPAILLMAVLFAGFHFLIVRLGVTFLLGAVLGLVVWRTGAIGPAMVFHVLHNGVVFIVSRVAWLSEGLHVGELDGVTHLPVPLICIAGGLVIVGLGLTLGPRPAGGRGGAMLEAGAGLVSPAEPARPLASGPPGTDS